MLGMTGASCASLMISGVAGREGSGGPERVASGIIRIISARRATKRERRAYPEGD